MDAASADDSARGRLAQRLLFALVFILGAWLRIHHFDRPGLWVDEYGTWWVIAADSYTEVAARAWEVQGQSPFYYLIVRGVVDVFGLASWSLRLPSLLFGVLVLPVGYALTRELFRDHRPALLAMTALAIHDLLIRYSQEARPYALALALVLASFALFVRVLRGSGTRERVAFAFVTAATVYAHYLFGVALLVQIGYALFQRADRRRRALWPLAGAVLLTAPTVPQVLQLAARRSTLDWVGDPASVSSSLGTIATKFFDPWPLGLAAGTVVILLVFGARAWRGDPGDRPGLLLAWLITPFALVIGMFALLDVNLIIKRYVLCAAPAARILVGVLLAIPRRHPLLDALPVLVFCAATVGWVLLPHYEDTATFAFRENQHWDDAVGELVASYREGDEVLVATRFVEMDLVVNGTASEATRDFVTWPFEAHVPEDVRIPYTPLPYSVNGEMRPAIAEIARDAFAARRVWLLGWGPSIKSVIQLVATNPQVHVTRRDRHGEIHLLLLTR